MIENLPNWINVLFLFTTIVTIALFHLSNGKRRLITLFIILWSLIQGCLSYNGFYQVTTGTPPRLGLVIIPVVLAILFGLRSRQLKRILIHRDTRKSTFLHSIRLLIEIVLLHLFLNDMIPELMTFEGRNFDIIMGITAPILGILYLKNKISKELLLAWNIIGLVLILVILNIGILSSEMPFQQFGFEQPNRAVLYFPFILLPATVVPIVLFTHITDIIKLRREIKIQRFIKSRT